MQISVLHRSLLPLLLLTACPPEADDDSTPAADDDSVSGDDDSSTGDDDSGTPGDADGDGSLDEVDCDDTDATVFPGAPEFCDGVDQNCASDSEDDLASFLPTAGGGVDLTADLSAGVAVTIAENGAVRLCGGAWSGQLILSGGTTVTVRGEDGHPVPRFATAAADAIAANGAATITGLEFDHTRITVGRGGSAIIEDSELTSALVYVYPTGILELRRADIHTQDGTYFVAGMNDGIDDLPREVLVEDSVLTDMQWAFSGNFHLTVRDSQVLGASNLGSVTDLLLEDSTTEGPYSVAGDGTTSAVVRRVTSTIDGNGATFSNLASVSIDELDATSLTGGTVISISNTLAATIEDSTFVNNAPGSGRFAIGLDGTGQTEMSVAVSRTTFEGAGVSAAGPTALVVTASEFSGTGESAVRAYLTHDLSITDTAFTGCESGPVIGTGFDASGGAVYAQVDGYTATIADCEITGGSAEWYGGGLFLNGGTLFVDNATLSGNTAAQRGGGIAVQAGTATITNSTFEDGSAVYGGGGLCALGGTTTVTGGHFFRNGTGAPSIHGGGLSVGGATVSLVGVDLGVGADDNTPHDIDWTDGFGGFVSYDGAATVTCTGQGCN